MGHAGKQQGRARQKNVFVEKCVRALLISFAVWSPLVCVSALEPGRCRHEKISGPDLLPGACR